MRVFVSILLASASLASAALAGPVTLRSDPVASAEGVTLADLFEGAGRAGGEVVAPAPRAGSTTVLDAGRVASVAARAGLEWSNTAGQRRILVRSPGAAPASATASAQVPTQRAAQAEVLVWARNINTGEIVSAEDLTWGRAVSPADAVGDPDAVIGLAARRPLRANAAAASRDVSAPVVIRRGETVQVAWRSGGLTLRLQATAQGAAAVGEPLRVLNPSSRRTFDVVATGPGQAAAGPEAERLRTLRFQPASARYALR